MSLANWWWVPPAEKRSKIMEGFESCYASGTPPDPGPMRLAIFNWLQKYYKLNDRRFDTNSEFWNHWEWRDLRDIVSDLCSEYSSESSTPSTPPAPSPSRREPIPPADPNVVGMATASDSSPLSLSGSNPWLWAVLGGLVFFVLFSLLKKR